VIQAASSYWTILRIALAERLAYRGDFALGTLMRFLPIVTQIFLWGAIFASLKASAGEDELANYRYSDIIAYYLLTMVSRAFSSMPGLASGIARQIRSGEIKKFLIQPIDLLGFLFMGRVAHKLAYYSVAIGPFALVFFLCRGFFSGFPGWETFAAFVISLLLSFLLGFFLESCFGLAGFWFLEINSFLFVYMLFNFFLSGHMFPLDMLPEPWKTLVTYVPLQYLAYFPSAVWLQKVEGAALWQGIGIQAAWTLFFIVASRIMLWRGLRRYSAYGG
jgi:ABC-2 type transport system permease protein